MEKIGVIMHKFYYSVYNIRTNSYTLYTYSSNYDGHLLNPGSRVSDNGLIYTTKAYSTKSEVLVDLMEFINNKNYDLL